MKNFKCFITSLMIIITCFMLTGCFGLTNNSESSTQTPVDEWASATTSEKDIFLEYFTETCSNDEYKDKFAINYEKKIDDVKVTITANIYKYNDKYEGVINYSSGTKTYEMYLLNSRLYVKKTLESTKTKFSLPLDFNSMNINDYLDTDAREVVSNLILIKSLGQNVEIKVKEDILKSATCNILNKTSTTSNNFKLNLNYDQITIDGLLRNNIETVLKYSENKIYYFSYYCDSVLASDEYISNQELSYSISTNVVTVEFPTLQEYTQVV